MSRLLITPLTGRAADFRNFVDFSHAVLDNALLNTMSEWDWVSQQIKRQTLVMMAIGAAVMVVVFILALRFWAEYTANDPENVRTQLTKANTYYGQGDYQNAILWLNKAAAQGNTEAQDALGYIYANGKGVTVDSVKAVYWYKQAADQGDYKAHEALKKLNVITAKPPSFVPGE